ncbi:MAG: phytanoyl-CoA dioxygenase family protein, partial [Terriglobales bacterium]
MTSVKSLYEKQGYHVFRRLISDDLIDTFNTVYDSLVKPHRHPLLRQSAQWDQHHFDEHGAMTNPLLNSHLHPSPVFSDFTTATLDIGCSQALQDALVAISGSNEFCLMQTMIFEQAVTPPHQDWYYLDSLPHGHLNSAWIALEDIHQDAAHFFVIPESIDFLTLLPKELIKHQQRYEEKMWEVIRENYGGNIVRPEMKKGDVIVWNSRLIHGSTGGSDASKTRRSMTAAYLPAGLAFGNQFQQQSGPIFMKLPHQAMSYA